MLLISMVKLKKKLNITNSNRDMIIRDLVQNTSKYAIFTLRFCQFAIYCNDLIINYHEAFNQTTRLW